MSSSPKVFRHPNPESEIAELKEKLKEMSSFCLQLQKKLEYMENKQMPNSEMQTIETQKTENGYDLASLKEKMRELVTMNVNWQKYNAQQEKTILEQKEQIERLKRELEMRSGNGQLPESQQIEFDQLLLAKKRECSSLEDEKEEVEEENRHLRVKLSELERSFSNQKEHCQLLEAQLVAYQEDFKIERSDRERAQSRIAELETKLRESQFKNQMSSPVQASSGYSPYDTFHHHLPYEMNLRGRGVYQTDGVNDSAVGANLSVTASSQNDHFDHNKTSKKVVASTPGVYQTDGLDETDSYHQVIELTENTPSYHISLSDLLSCPNCRKVFTREQHLDLLEHMEDCA